MLSASPFRFHPSFARVISGEDEARFDWYAANLLAGTFAALVEPASAPEASRARDQSALALAQPFVAAADLGGASTQIAHPASAWDTDDVRRVHAHRGRAGVKPPSGLTGTLRCPRPWSAADTPPSDSGRRRRRTCTPCPAWDTA